MTSQLSGIPVLVTGGSGFIGTHLVAALVDHGARVTNVDVRPPKLAAHDKYWRTCDLLDRQSLQGEFDSARPKLVYNLAANTDISQGLGALEVNTAGLTNVIDAIHLLADDCFLVHTSTQLVMQPGHQPQHAADFAPYSEYGRSKADSELLLHKETSLQWAIVRPTNVWGPWHPTFADQIWRYIGQGYYLHATGRDPRRSYGYVANVVYQLVRLFQVDRNQVSGQTFYVGDEPIPSSIWLDSFSRALRGKPVRRAPQILLRLAAAGGDLSGRLGGPSPINSGRLYRMSTDYAVPMSQTFDVLGQGPISLDAGVKATVEWIWARRGESDASR